MALHLAVGLPAGCFAQGEQVERDEAIGGVTSGVTGGVDLRNVASEISGKVSYGMYVGDLKVGYRVENMYVSKEDPDVLIEEIDQEMSFYSGKGRSQEVFRWNENSRTMSSLKDGLVTKFDFFEKINGRERTIVVDREEDHYNVTTTIGDKSKKDKYGVYGNYLLNDFYDFAHWLTSQPPIGSTLLLDGNSFTVEGGRAVTTITYRGKVASKYKEHDCEYFVEKVDHTQDKQQEWYDKRGRLIHAFSGRFELRKESDLAALKYDPPEAADLSRIPIDGLLDEDQKEKMVVLLRNSSAISLHQDHRQRIDRCFDGYRFLVATILKDFRTKLPEPLRFSDKKKFLSSTKTIQASDSKIKELAATITKAKKNPTVLQKADMLQRWVFDNLKKQQAVDLPTSLEVLEKKRGDCTEHALLLVALLRAAGIPAREVHGLVYSDRKNVPGFSGHRWVEFHDGHQWVSADPTVGKLYVLATYISFGSENPVVYELLGLSIKVLKTQPEIDDAKP